MMMDEMRGFDSNYEDDKGLIMSPENNLMTPFHDQYDHQYHYRSLIHHQIPAGVFGSEEYGAAFGADESGSVNHHHQKQGGGGDEEDEDSCSYSSSTSLMMIKSRIVSHPSYPKLLDAYIDCQKFGAPAETVSLLEEMRAEKGRTDHSASSMCTLGLDPQLDHFMDKYCEILVKYKCDLSKPFDEATSFLNNIQTQLRDLCNGDVALSSDEEMSRGEIEIEEGRMKKEDGELKDKLLRMYGSHISSLKQEFSKKKKKGKLPKEARQTLLQWWNLHCKWPYPTEGDKIALAESTGLDQKQINNWFINQRKRHWKSPENMQMAIMDNLSAHFFLE